MIMPGVMLANGCQTDKLKKELKEIKVMVRGLPTVD